MILERIMAVAREAPQIETLADARSYRRRKSEPKRLVVAWIVCSRPIAATCFVVAQTRCSPIRPDVDAARSWLQKPKAATTDLADGNGRLSRADGSIVPPDMVAPTFLWHDPSGCGPLGWCEVTFERCANPSNASTSRATRRRAVRSTRVVIGETNEIYEPTAIPGVGAVVATHDAQDWADDPKHGSSASQRRG